MSSAADRLAAALADRYTIERELGQGGMATVYLAQDLKHDRKVAIKVLKPELAAVLGADRFIQEITTTAQLQHQNILPLFDSGRAVVPPLPDAEPGQLGEAFLYYVMPYVEGETLRQTLSREKQLGVNDAVRITSEVADALSYAHAHGVVHRDIKPENILLHAGRPIVADFGIALAVSAAAGGRMTESGLSLGTPHYMSPEQATAEKDVTGRSDIYSLGAVLYEMLTGNPPHEGSSAQQIIMRIVTEAPVPATTLRKSVPPNVAAALDKALEKLPADRFATAKAFAEALTNPGFATASTASAAPDAAAPAAARHWRRVALVTGSLAASLAVALAVIIGVTRLGRRTATPPTRIRQIVLGSMGTAPGIVAYGTAIAPDGSAIAYTDTAGGRYELMLKERDQLAPRMLATLASARPPGPCFSPDGRWIAYADGKLYRVSRGGGAPVPLSDSSIVGSTAWLGNGTIVGVGAGSLVLFATPSSGGPTKRVFTTSGARGILGHVSAVPGADAVLVTVIGAGSARAVLLDLRTDTTRVIERGAVAAWVVNRSLVFVGDHGTLLGAPFDRRHLSVSGTPVPLVDSIQINSYPLANPVGDIAIGADGTLLYVRAAALAGGSRLRLARVSLDGSAVLLDALGTVPVAPLGGLDLSPDGRRVVVSLEDSTSGRNDIYVFDLRGGPPTRITFTGATNIRPQWSPDGRRIMYVSDAGGGALRLWAKPAGGGGTGVLLTGIRGIFGGEWSPDGRWIVYRTDAGVTGNRDIFALRTAGDTTPEPLATTPAAELGPALSPDGRWLAYSSNRNGAQQVFVRPFPKGEGEIWQVSPGPGFAPQWSHDGRRIFYQTDRDQMMAADVSTAPTFHVVRDTVLFSDPQYFRYEYYHDYAVTRDDRHFIMLEVPPAALGRGARVVEMDNWLGGALAAAHE